MKMVAVTMMVVCVLSFSACARSARMEDDAMVPHFPEEYQVKNRVDGEVSAFGLNIAPADEMGDWVVEWISDVADGDGFQYFIYSDPDSWDVYLYYPEGQEDIQMLTNDDVAVDCSDGILNVYVTTCQERSVPIVGEDKWILHFVAPMFGAWPSEIKLYWNDSEITCDAGF